MGLLDKIKNVFFEEEYVEVEEKVAEPKEKVSVAKKIETPEIRKREEKVEETKTVIEETPIIEEKPKFPMSFDDKDFEVEKTIELEEPVRETTIEFKEVETIPVEIEQEEEEPVIIESREKRHEELRYAEPEYEETVVQSIANALGRWRGEKRQSSRNNCIIVLKPRKIASSIPSHRL